MRPCDKCKHNPTPLHEAPCRDCYNGNGDADLWEAAGVKHDTGKPRWDLLPWDAVEDVVRVLTHGAEKYDDDNWRHVPHARARYFAAAMRHTLAWWRGERLDPEWGLPHLAHAASCLLFLAALDREEDGETCT